MGERGDMQRRKMGICRICAEERLICQGNIVPGVCRTCYGKERARKDREAKGALRRNTFWTEDESILLMKLWRNVPPSELLAALPHRTWAACEMQMHQLRKKMQAQVDAECADHRIRSSEYWQRWAAQRQHEPMHPAIAELIQTERRILTAIARVSQ